jgi:hypothetical protein
MTTGQGQAFLSQHKKEAAMQIDIQKAISVMEQILLGKLSPTEFAKKYETDQGFREQWASQQSATQRECSSQSNSPLCTHWTWVHGDEGGGRVVGCGSRHPKSPEVCTPPASRSGRS